MRDRCKVFCRHGKQRSKLRFWKRIQTLSRGGKILFGMVANLAELAPVRRSPVEACEQLGDMSLVIRHAKVLGDKDGDAGIGPVALDKTMGRGPLLEKWTNEVFCSESRRGGATVERRVRGAWVPPWRTRRIQLLTPRLAAISLCLQPDYC